MARVFMLLAAMDCQALPPCPPTPQWLTMLVLRRIAMSILACCLVAQSSFSAIAQQPSPPSLKILHPLGVLPGLPAEIGLTGEQLGGNGKVWTSSSRAVAYPTANQSDSAATCQLDLPANTPLGILGLRYYNGAGVSNLRLMLVDDLPTISANAQQKTLATALSLELPTAVEGRVDAESACYFKFKAEAGQRVSLEVYARRLASPLDPVLRVLDSSGQELAYRDDEPGLMGDCRLSFQAPQSGEYFLELRDVRYSGGPDYRFRLRLGSFPLASVVYPPVVKRGTTTEVLACVTEGVPVAAVPVTFPTDYSDEIWRFGIKGAGKTEGGSALVSVLASDLEQALEREPNETAEQAFALALPAGISGRFQQQRDKDWYSFRGQAGEFLNVHAHTRSIGSPAEVSLKLYSAEGNLLSETNPSLNDEAQLNLALPATGEYRLLVDDLAGRGGEAFVYYLALQTQTPGFSLVVDRDRVSPPQQGICSVKVTVHRNRPSEPITLELRNGPPGAVLSDHVIASDQKEATLKIRLPEGCEAGAIYPSEIVGICQQDGKSIEVVAENSAALLQELNWVSYVSSDITRQLALGVGPAFPIFLKLSLEPADCLLPRLVGTASWVVKAERLHNFADAIAIELKGLPPGVAATGTTIDKGRNDTTIMLAGGEALAEGTTPIEVVAEAVLQDQPQTIRLAGNLRVIPPLRVSLAIAGSLPQEGKQKLTITVERFGKESNPAQIKLQNLPEGVTGPAEIVVPAGVNTLDIELSAALTAAPGKTNKLAAQATTKFQEQDVMAVSPFVELEVVDGK